MSKQRVITGLENFLAQGLPEIEGMFAGLITNDTGVDHLLQRGIDRLHASERLRLRALFGPEHGLLGNAQDGVEVGSAVDPRTSLPVYSLYGETLRPTADMLHGLDVLIYDIQDVGARYYTYLTTLAYAQEAAAQAGLPFVVLDRPNPLTGTGIEGNMLDPRFASFVGVDAIPIRYGLTVGELARYFARLHGWPQPLVAPLLGWRRGMWFDECGLPWVQPSPNIPTLDAAILYPGTCLLEGTNLSEGRGTTRPFEVVGAPWLDPFQFAEALTRLALPGVVFRPRYFTPMFSKHQNASCGGVQIHLVARDQVQPVALALHLLQIARRLRPEMFAWRSVSSGLLPIDRLFGSDQLRLLLDRDEDVSIMIQAWAEPLKAFREACRASLLYEE